MEQKCFEALTFGTHLDYEPKISSNQASGMAKLSGFAFDLAISSCY
jgi:hypothetical protein